MLARRRPLRQSSPKRFPPTTTAVSLTGPAGWTCVLATLTCTDTTTMAANTTANFTFVVNVNTNVASGTHHPNRFRFFDDR